MQSSKTAGSIKVEATSPGLTAAVVTIASRAAKLRPQVAAWEREAPTGAGVTGLWRPVTAMADSVYTFRQDGNTLTGKVETSGGGGFGGRGAPSGGRIEDGKVEGSNISFRAGTTMYAGSVNGDQIELRQTGGAGRGGRGGARPVSEPGPRPAIGPPPDGSDPSFAGGRGGAQPPAATILRRAKR